MVSDPDWRRRPISQICRFINLFNGPQGIGLRSHERNYRQHCQTLKKKGDYENEEKPRSGKINSTLTESGLLAVLLQRQHDKVIELAECRAHRGQMRFAFSDVLTWLLARARAATSGRPFRRGIGGTLPRHP